MKISIITDIHHHGPVSRSCPNRDMDFPVLESVERFVDHTINGGADVLLDLGDRIDDLDPETDVTLAQDLAAVFDRFPRERVHLMGNHDVVHLSKEKNEEIYGCSFDSRVVDLGDTRLIAWQPSVVLDYVKGGFAPTGNHLAWLVRALLNDDRPAIIATHVSLSGRPQIGNFYHQFHPAYSAYPDHEVVRAAVEKTGRAAIWLSGHSHWNTWVNIANIHHFTLQSHIERYTTYPKTAATFADLVIDDGQFTLTVHGNDPLHMRLPFRKSGDQFWLPPVVRR